MSNFSICRCFSKRSCFIYYFKYFFFHDLAECNKFNILKALFNTKLLIVFFYFFFEIFQNSKYKTESSVEKKIRAVEIIFLNLVHLIYQE